MQGDPLDRGVVAALLLSAAATAILLQATRVFLSYMVFVIDQAERVQLGATAGTVYLGIALGALIPRLAGLRRTVLLLSVGMVATRLALQFWTLPEARMLLGAATVVLAGWLFPTLLTIARSATAAGFGVGLALDVAFRIGRDSLDLPFSPSLFAHGATIFLGLATIFAALLLYQSNDPPRTSGVALGALAFGPALALHQLTFGNLGAIQLRLDVDMVPAAWLASIGLILGLMLDVFLARPRRQGVGSTGGMTTMIPLSGAGGLGLLVFWQDLGGAGAIGLVIGTAAAVALIIAALRSENSADSVSATALWLTLGMVIHAALLFVYFTATGLPVLIVVLYGVIALAALIANRSPLFGQPEPAISLGGIGAVTAALLVSAFLLTSRSAEQNVGDPLPAEFTAMTYNIQSGFSRDNYWDLEEIARVIEGADPDIVILQEVGRGWPIMTGMDQAHWLSNRLGMQLVWGPASRDDLWGNAILTRAPIVSTEWIKYDTTDNLRRGAVRAIVETEAGPIAVIGTHLDNPGTATSARQQQIIQLLDFWGGQEPALIAGDFNTIPGSDAMIALEDGGLIDTGDGLSADATTSEDGRRIDYVIISPGLEVVDTSIPDTWASDHRPFVADLRIIP